MTTNIPDKKPECIFHEEDWKQIKAWMETRPIHDLDTCVNHGCRWTYHLTDHGLWEDIMVTDNGFNETFTVEQDPSTW